MKDKKLVYGVGINDADYPVSREAIIDGKRCVVWLCPYHERWKGMIRRCYSSLQQIKQPSYVGCSVIEEWKRFSNFKSWMETQDWEGKQLDKDLLYPGNKVYSPDNCIFVNKIVNGFITDSSAARGEWPIGVSYHKTSGKFEARCKDFSTGKKKNLGYFDTPEKAHKAWLDKKTQLAYALALQQSDPRIAAALIDRYENYEKHFGGVSSHA